MRRLRGAARSVVASAAALVALAWAAPVVAPGPPALNPWVPKYAFFDVLDTSEDGTATSYYFPEDGPTFVTAVADARGSCRFVSVVASPTNNVEVNVRVYSDAAADEATGFILVRLEAGQAWYSNGLRVTKVILPTQAGWTAGNLKIEAMD